MITNILLLAIFNALLVLIIQMNRLINRSESVQEIMRVIYTIIQEIRRNNE